MRINSTGVVYFNSSVRVSPDNRGVTEFKLTAHLASYEQLVFVMRKELR